MSRKCDECKRCAVNDDMTNVIMSSADWQRNEQRHLRREKRMWIALIVAITMLFASNVGWLIYESQFETITYDYEQDGQGTNIIGNENEVNNGAEIKN